MEPEITGTRDNIRRANFDHWLIAGPTERVIAFGSDLLFTLLLSMMVNVIRHTPTILSDTLRIWIVIHWFYESACLPVFGTTLGRKIMGLRVYSPRRDGPPDFQQSVLRTLLFWLLFPLNGMSITPILYRRDRRGWHDQLAETVTLGSHKSIPKGIWSKMGGGLVAIQSLSLFCFFAALLASRAIPNKIHQLTQGATHSRSCEDGNPFLQEPSEALFAMIVSPAWGKCWDTKKFSLGNLQGSQIYRYAEIARLVNAASSTSTISRQVANLQTPHELNVVESQYLAPYKLFVQSLLAAPDKESRIKLLKDELHTATHPIVVSSLTDRLWAEELASNQLPSVALPNDTFPEWNRSQTCWVEALGLSDGDLCVDNPYQEFVNQLDDMETSSDASELDDLGERLAEMGHTEGHQLMDIWKSHQAKNPAKAKEVLAQFPETSPLYHWAVDWSQLP